MLLAVIISYAEKIVNRKAVPFGTAFFLRFSPPSLSETKKPGDRFLFRFPAGVLAAKGNSAAAFKSPIPLLPAFRRRPFLSPGIKKKLFPLSPFPARKVHFRTGALYYILSDIYNNVYLTGSLSVLFRVTFFTAKVCFLTR